MKPLDNLLVSDLVNTAGIYHLGNIHLGISRNTVAELWDVHTWVRKFIICHSWVEEFGSAGCYSYI